MNGEQVAAAFLASVAAAAIATAQQSVTLSAPGTPENAPTVLVGCLMPAGGTTSMPGSGGSSGTGPAGMNTDAANSGVFFAINLGKKHPKNAQTSYTLEGVDATQLKQYARARVEVQGVLLPPPNPAVPADNTMAAGSGQKAPAKSPSRFRVTAIRQVPGSCGGR
jgi:hypothetical protein